MDFPNDANGDALRRLEAAGDDLAVSREIEFAVVFPTKDSAEQFTKRLAELGYEASFELADTIRELPWEVVVVNCMRTCYADIGKFEDLLQNIANPLNGRNDGWGCYSAPSSSASI